MTYPVIFELELVKLEMEILLTPWSRVLEKLIITFYGTQIFITMFTKATTGFYTRQMSPVHIFIPYS
jgi:hypothetical protein